MYILNEVEILHGIVIADIIILLLSSILLSVFAVFSKRYIFVVSMIPADLFSCAWIIDWLTGPGMSTALKL